MAAKDGAQETVVNLVGMLTGTWLISQLGGDLWLTWAWFLVLSVVHLWCNFRAVRAVQLDTLNAQRLELIVDHFA